jgi:hypothetical protein
VASAGCKAPVTVIGGVTGAPATVYPTSPLIIVCGAVLELVKVLERTPKVSAIPSEGVVAAWTAVKPNKPKENTIAKVDIKILLNFCICIYY